MEPAATIIAKLGGPPKVAEIVGVHVTRVYSWMRAKDSGGTGGRIPQGHHRPLLKAAQDLDVREITAESFLPLENEAAAS